MQSSSLLAMRFALGEWPLDRDIGPETFGELDPEYSLIQAGFRHCRIREQVTLPYKNLLPSQLDYSSSEI